MFTAWYRHGINTDSGCVRKQSHHNNRSVASLEISVVLHDLHQQMESAHFILHALLQVGPAQVTIRENKTYPTKAGFFFLEQSLYRGNKLDWQTGNQWARVTNQYPSIDQCLPGRTERLNKTIFYWLSESEDVLFWNMTGYGLSWSSRSGPGFESCVRLLHVIPDLSFHTFLPVFSCLYTIKSLERPKNIFTFFYFFCHLYCGNFKLKLFYGILQNKQIIETISSCSPTCN